MNVNFLGAAMPLTKTLTPTSKSDYPMAGNFTSYTEQVTTSQQMYAAVVKHAALNHCMLKGQLARPLTHESRKNSTSTDEATEFICLDWDKHITADIDADLARMGLGDVSYVMQYSASHGLPKNMGTVSAHMFMLLDAPLPAPALKAWLQDVNLNMFNDQLRLSASKDHLSYPLDITTCQNDKLLFIAPPVFQGMTDPLKVRITHVQRKLDAIPIQRLGERHIAAVRNDALIALNKLRKRESLKTRTAGTTWVAGIEVMNKPTVGTITGVKQQGEFIRLNLNGGDSWAYWHPVSNFELTHDFKTDTWYRTKELAPAYYAELMAQQRQLNATPTEEGDLILAFRDLKSAEYYNGLWNPGKNKLEMYRAKNETQLDHWMRSHGRTIGDFIQTWDIQYDPKGTWVVDADQHLVNTFIPSKYMCMDPDASARFPAILNIIKHMLGWESQLDDRLIDHFLNWIACIFQRKHKPLTAWVCHGNEGTGKGYFVKAILAKLLGHKNTQTVLISNIEDTFNGWLEGKLFIFIDEVDIEDFKEKGRVSSRLRNYITEPTLPLRRMRQSTIDVPNHTSFLFSSNRPQPVFIPESDRRYNVGNFQPTKLPRPDDEVIENELEAFAQYLLAHKADIKQANDIVQTTARERVQKLGITSINETCNSLRDGDFEALWMSMPDIDLLNSSQINNDHTKNAQAYVMLLKNIVTQGFPDKLSRDEILIILQYNVGNMPVTPNKFTSLLRHHGIETKQIRKNNQKTYGIDVDWKISQDFRSELLGTLSNKRVRVVK